MIDKITPQIAAMFLGQKCDVEFLCSDKIDSAFEVGDIWPDSTIHGRHLSRVKAGEVKLTPHLRRLESMTEEEAREIIKLYKGRDAKLGDNLCDLWEKQTCDIEDAIGSPAVWLYLLSKGFDLFGLIDAGLAKEIAPANPADLDEF